MEHCTANPSCEQSPVKTAQRLLWGWGRSPRARTTTTYEWSFSDFSQSRVPILPFYTFFIIMSIQLSGNLFIYSPRIFTRFTSSDITLPVAGGEMVWLCCHGSVVHLVLSSEDVGLREGTLWLQPTELASHGAGPGIWGLCSFLGSSWIWEAVVTTWWLLPPAMLGEGTCAKHSDVPSASS